MNTSRACVEDETLTRRNRTTLRGQLRRYVNYVATDRSRSPRLLRKHSERFELCERMRRQRAV